MRSHRSQGLVRAGALGAVAGMRSMMPLALLSNRRDARGRGGRRRRGLPAALMVKVILALTELGFDKWPKTPSRLAPGPIGARLLVGAWAGGEVARRRGSGRALGAAVGAGAALLTALVAFELRRAAQKRTGWPDAVFAVAEDVIALTLGRAAVR